jgi:hypothetical protein
MRDYNSTFVGHLDGHISLCDHPVGRYVDAEPARRHLLQLGLSQRGDHAQPASADPTAMKRTTSRSARWAAPPIRVHSRWEGMASN